MLKQNNYRISILAITNIVPTVVILCTVNVPLSTEHLRDVLTISSVLLGITTATVVFFGEYIESTGKRLFELKAILTAKPEAVKKLPDSLLKLVFLQFFLWWSLVTNCIATLLSVFVLYQQNTMVGILALSFMVMGILTLFEWMSFFVMASTPGKRTYDALKEEVDTTEKNKQA